MADIKADSSTKRHKVVLVSDALEIADVLTYHKDCQSHSSSQTRIVQVTSQYPDKQTWLHGTITEPGALILLGAFCIAGFGFGLE